MKTKLLCYAFSVLLMICSMPVRASGAGEPGLEIRAVKAGATVEIDRVMEEGKALISVVDTARNPLLGLTTADFTVTRSGRTAKILSVQPLSESLDVPRHIALVLDNSFSMSERNAVQPLLAGVDELLKIIRPIDRVHVIVFDDKKTMNMGGRNLHVQTFASNQTAELREFVAAAYRENILTTKTVLYEAMLAGIDLVSKMPAGEPRFMVVFSDGADLNSAYKRGIVLETAGRLDRFNTYAIDYMPDASIDEFLSKFVSQNGGQIWKATSETNLVPIFQSVASKMQYHYIISYIFPPSGTLAVSPGSLSIDEVRTMSESKSVLETKIDVSSLTLRPVVDTVYGIAQWKAVVTNAAGTAASLAGEGQPAQDIAVALPVQDLQALAAGGDLTVKLELQDRKGQNLVLTAPPVKVTLFRTSAGIAVEPSGVTIEEIKTIDASPMLAHIYFASGSSEIGSQYVRFAGPEQTAGFDEQKFRGTIEKYYQVLNIIGKRLTDRPEAVITLVGCNDGVGVEKGKTKLSARRAEAVRDYLQTVWRIAPERMTIEARNLPAIPSARNIKDGQAENRRVEVYSNDMAILAPIRSVYLTTRIDANELKVKPDFVSPHGIANWKISATNKNGNLADMAGQGAPSAEIRIPLDTKNLEMLAAGGDIAVKAELQDRKGQNMKTASLPVKVNFIQLSQLLAQKQELRVQEKYALILFDFDKDTLSDRNQAIVNRIVARIGELPKATVAVVGYTDIIGKEAYNMKLSKRRALAVFNLLTAAMGETAGDRISHTGVGPNSPLYDNLLPEGRAFNRTVTITLEYMSAE